MTTSIDKTTNWRKAVQGVGYKGAADPSAVAVEQINTNPKALQVAKAFGQFGNSLGQFGETQAALQAKVQAEETRKATALQKDQARVLAAREAALFNEAQKSENYNEDSTYDGSFNSYVGSEKGAGYTTARESLIENPEALAVFENTFKLQTEASLIKAIGDSVLKQQKDVVGGLLPTVWKEAQDKNPTDPTAAFRATESQLFTRLTAKPKKGGYGLKNEIAAGVLGDIFNTHALSRDEDGRANTYLAEQYILSGKGGDEMREKLTLTVLKQKSLAASERSTVRAEKKIAEEKEARKMGIELRSGKWATPDKNILANSDLSPAQKEYLLGINKLVRQQKAIEAEPELKRQAYETKRDAERLLERSAVLGDYTALGFNEGEIPSADELEDALTDKYFGKMPNQDEFNKLIETAESIRSVSDVIDTKTSLGILDEQFVNFKKEFKDKTFTRYLDYYAKDMVRDKTPVKTYLDNNFNATLHGIIEEKVAQGITLTRGVKNDAYKEAAEITMKPFIEYFKATHAEKQKLAEGAGGTEEPTGEVSESTQPTGLTAPNEAALEQWNKYMDPNASEEVLEKRETFLELWDKRFTRPVESDPEDTSNKKYQLSLTDALIPPAVQESVANAVDDYSNHFIEGQVRNILFNKTTYEEASEERVQEALAEIEKIGIEAWRAKN